MADKIFIDGMYFKLPQENAPEFIKGSLEFDVKKFAQFMNDHQNVGGFLKVDLKVAKSGKGYAELNTWKPTDKNFKQPQFKEKVEEEEVPRTVNGMEYPADDINSEDIPFN